MLLCMNPQLQYALQDSSSYKPDTGPAIDVSRRLVERADEVLTAKALDLLASLHRGFNARRLQLLAMRQWRQAEIDRGPAAGLSAGDGAYTRRSLAHRRGAR